MYSAQFKKLLPIITKLSSFFGVISFSFDIKNDKFKHDPSRRTRHQLAFCGVVLEIFFVVFRTVQFEQRAKFDNSLWEQVPICWAFVFASVCIVAPLSVLFFCQDKIINYNTQFQVKWMPKYDPEVAPLSRLMDSSVRICIVSLTLLPWACPIFYVRYPEMPVFGNTAVKEYLEYMQFSSETVRFIHMLALVADFPILVVGSYVVFYAILALGMIVIVYCAPLYPILRELRFDLSRRHEAIDEVRQPRNLMREYNCLKLLNLEVMETMGPLLLYIHGTYGQFCLFCNFVAIKKWDSLTYFTKLVMLISWSVNGQLVWGLSLETFGRMDMEAKKVPKSWKFVKSGGKIELKILSKFRKSMKPLTFGEEGVFTMKRMTVLKFFRGIIKGTFRALLTIGQ
ncbi:hypothetical protein Fcan01_10176 [Folsomia candida]|uniref:Gustatory receptor n=1 Tax=Folsomia candida TaxID=158441 RepID=A0A226EAY0_FOLCA|nr:hypothetical protein Fcan01_10176 [Folsomia candida]